MTTQALVTGGNGFVGAAVTRALVRSGASVRLLLRPNGDRRNLQGLLSDGAVEIVQGDVREAETLLRAAQGCALVFHVAAFYSSHPNDASLLYAVNVTGTENVLRAAAEAGVARLVHTSTIGVIGRPAAADELPTEETPFAPDSRASHYVHSKYQGEQLALAWAARQALAVVVVNPTAPVGVGDWRPTATGARILAYLRGQVPSFPPGGVNFCGVDDIAQGHLLAATHGQAGRRYILGHPAGNLKLTAFLALMELASGRPLLRRDGGWRTRLRTLLRRTPASPPVPTMQPAMQPAALTCNPTRALQELAWTPAPLLPALRAAVIWFQAQKMV